MWNRRVTVASSGARDAVRLGEETVRGIETGVGDAQNLTLSKQTTSLGRRKESRLPLRRRRTVVRHAQRLAGVRNGVRRGIDASHGRLCRQPVSVVCEGAY